MRRSWLVTAIGGMGGGGGSMATSGTAGSGGHAGSSGSSGTAGTTRAGGPNRAGGQLSGSSGCSLFTPDDVWNADVSGKPVDATNTSKMNTLLGAVKIHPDF